MSTVSVSQLGQVLTLQNNSGSADASAPEGGLHLYASGSGTDNTVLYMQKEGSATAIQMGALPVAGDSGTGTVAAGQTLTIAGGTGLDTSMSGQTLTFSMDLNELSAVTPAAGDQLALVDADDNSSKKATIANLAGLMAGTVTSTGISDSSGVLSLDIQNMTAETGVADGDLIVIDDGAGGTLRKMTRANFIESAALDSINIDGGAIDGTPIGANAQAAGEFTSISGSSTLQVMGASTLGNGTVTVSAAGVVSGSGNSTLHRVTADRGSFTTLFADTLDVNTINSTTTTANDLEVSDRRIVSALSASSANADGGGLRVGGGADSAGHMSILYDHGNTAMDFNVGGSTIAMLDGNSFDLVGAFSGSGDSTIHKVTMNQLVAATADINGGSVDGTVIGASTQAAAEFTTISGSGALNVVGAANFGPGNKAVIAADGGLTIDHFDADWTNAGRTVADMGVVTTMDLNGGSIDGTTIGASSQSSVKATTLSGSSTLSVEGVASFGPGALTTISAAGAVSGSGNFQIGGTLTSGKNNFSVDAAGAMSISSHISQADGGYVHADGGYDNGGVSIGGSGVGNFAGAVTVGGDGAGADAFFYGGASQELLKWAEDNNRLEATDSDGNMIYTLGGDGTGEYALDVTSGANNINKVRAAAFVTYSDRELKTEIAPMSESLEKVMKLDAVSYKMKNGGSKARQEIGFLAQEVAAVVPEVCAFDGNGTARGIDYSRMTSLLADAVKSQQLQIEDLKSVIAKLQK